MGQRSREGQTAREFLFKLVYGFIAYLLIPVVSAVLTGLGVVLIQSSAEVGSYIGEMFLILLGLGAIIVGWESVVAALKDIT